MDYVKLINENPDSEFLVPDNPYGYIVNIRHKAIHALYERYRDKNEIPPWCPLSDKQRYDFENMVLMYLIQKGILRYEE